MPPSHLPLPPSSPASLPENALFRIPLSRPWLWLLPVLIGASAWVPLQDPDLWWHLAIGRDLAHGGWPWIDSFSWTHKGQPLSFVPWLPSLYFYGVWLVAGVGGLVFLQGLHCALWLGLSLRYHQRLGSSLLWLLFVLFLVLPLVVIRLMLLRSQFIPYLFLPWAAAVGIFLRDHPGSRWKWVFVPWIALWVQSHASFALGFLFLGLLFVWPKIVSPDLRRHFWKEDSLLLLACFLACFLTPSGSSIFSFLSQHAQISAASHPAAKGSILSLTIEALPLPVSELLGLYAPWLGIFLLSLPAWFLLPWTTFGGEKIAWIFLLALPFYQVRFVGELGLFALLFLPHWITTLQRLSAHSLAAKRAFLLTCLAALSFVLLLLASIAFKGHHAAVHFPEHFGFSVDHKHFPTKITHFLKTHRPQGKMYNVFGPGGYLIWHLPEYPVFLDGRTFILYQEPFFYEHFAKFFSQTTSFTPYLHSSEYKILLTSIDAFSAVTSLNPSWQAVAVDDLFLLYLRWGRGNDEIIKKHAYYYLPIVHNHEFRQEKFQRLFQDPDSWKILGQEIRRAIRESLHPSDALTKLGLYYQHLDSTRPTPSSLPSSPTRP